MQAPTHVIAGTLIQKVFKNIPMPGWMRVTLIAGLGLFFHSVFDRIARLTYHPPDPDFNSVFWVSYHLLILLGFIVSMFYFWKPYKLGIFFSILPDFDWVVKHGSNALGVSPGWYDRPLIHETIHRFTDSVPPFSYLQNLPDLTHRTEGIIIEVLLITAMLFFISRLKSGKQ